MKWNYKKNLPIEGTYMRFNYVQNLIRADLCEFFGEGSEVVHAFESVGYNPEEFFLQKAYRGLSDDYHEFLKLLDYAAACKPWLENYMLDIYNGHLPILERPAGFTWGGIRRKIKDIDIICRLFFCETEKDLWDLILDLPARTMSSLIRCYHGVSLFDESYPFPVYLTNPERASECIAYIIIKIQNMDIRSNNTPITICVGDKQIVGRIIVLTPFHLGVELLSPIPYITGDRIIPEKYRGDVRFAYETEDGRTCLSLQGEGVAIDLLRDVYYEEMAMLEKRDLITTMLNEYEQREAEREKKFPKIVSKNLRLSEGLFSEAALIAEIQDKFFPDLRHIAFDTEFFKELKKHIEKEG